MPGGAGSTLLQFTGIHPRDPTTLACLILLAMLIEVRRRLLAAKAAALQPAICEFESAQADLECAGGHLLASSGTACGSPRPSHGRSGG